LSLSPYTFLSNQRNFPHSSQTSFEERTEMTFDRRLANITGPRVRGLYFPFALNLIKMAMTLGIGDEHFVACLMLFINVQWDIFNKCHMM